MNRAYLIFLILIASCSSISEVEYVDNKVLSWSEAVEFINSEPEKIENVWQAHSLHVNIELKNGIILKTKEQIIDEVFSVLRKCGSPCKHIGWITE